MCLWCTGARQGYLGRMTRHLTFSGPSARLHHALLMGLFRLAVTRGLYGRFARGLGRLFPAGNAVWLHEDGAPPFRIALDDGYWTRFALYHAPYEPEVGAVLRAAEGAAPLFCDLGANKGWWTTRAAPLFDRVIAVEASGATFAELQGNAGHLPNVTLHRAAVHARSGETMTFVNTHLSHASARLEGGEAAPPGTAPRRWKPSPSTIWCPPARKRSSSSISKAPRSPPSTGPPARWVTARC